MLQALYEYRYFEILNSARWKMGVRRLIYLSWTILTVRIFVVFAGTFLGCAIVAGSGEVTGRLQSAGVAIGDIVLSALLIVGVGGISSEKYSEKRLAVRQYANINFLKTLDFPYRDVIVIYRIFPLLAAKFRECAAAAAVVAGGFAGLWAWDGWFVFHAFLTVVTTGIVRACVTLRNAVTTQALSLWFDVARYAILASVIIAAVLIGASYSDGQGNLAAVPGILRMLEPPGFTVVVGLTCGIAGARMSRLLHTVEYPKATLKAYRTRRRVGGISWFLLAAYGKYLGARDGFRGIRMTYFALTGFLGAAITYRLCFGGNDFVAENIAKLFDAKNITQLLFFPAMVTAAAILEFWQQKVGPNVWRGQMRFLWEQGWDSWKITAINMGFFLLPLMPAAALMVGGVYFMVGSVFWVVFAVVLAVACSRLMAYALVGSTKPSEEGREVDIAAEVLSMVVSLGGYAIFILMPVTGWSYGLYCLYALIVGGVTWWALRRRLINCRAFTLKV